MFIYKISDSIVFNTLKDIEHGFLEIEKINGQILKFGNPSDDLKVCIKIKDESFNYNLIKNGSIGLGECYMKGFFTTNNLSDLIELTARNIKINILKPETKIIVIHTDANNRLWPRSG